MDGEVTWTERQLRLLADSFANIYYELILIADVIDNRIVYIAKSSGLARRVFKRDFTNNTLYFLVETISGGDVRKLGRILDVIRAKYELTAPEHRRNMLFITDMSYVYDVEGKSSATYKFTPLTCDDGKLKYMLISIGFSTGNLKNKIAFINTNTFERKTMDLVTGTWHSMENEPLTPVEITVLALSAEGKTVHQIAGEINKAYDTVKSIRKRIFAKMKVENITEAIMIAINHKII